MDTRSFAIFCKTVYTSFTEWSQLPLIFWVQNHEKIRGQMIRFLSKPMPKAQGQRQGFERFVVQSDEYALSFYFILHLLILIPGLTNGGEKYIVQSRNCSTLRKISTRSLRLDSIRYVSIPCTP